MKRERKIEIIADSNFIGDARGYAVRYLKALRSNDKKVIEEFEQYGSDVHKCISNYRAFDQAKKFGYNEFMLNEYGWFKHSPFQEVEEIEFEVKGEYQHNGIDVGVSANGLWVYGYNYSTGNGGGGSGMSIWNTDKYHSKEDAIIGGMERLIDLHKKAKERFDKFGDSCGNFKPKLSNKIVRLIEERLFDLKCPQLEFNF